MAAYFEITPIKYELTMKLYLQQIGRGPNANQEILINKTDFGTLAVNDWTVFDALDGGNLIADAEGLHIDASQKERSFSLYFNLVFKSGRFKDSTLIVLGHIEKPEGQWSIVGGTGEFTLAQGICSYKVVKSDTGSSVRELNIHAFYAPVKN